MRHRITLIGLTVCLLGNAGEPAATKSTANWSQRMRELAVVLPEMLTYTEKSGPLDAAAKKKLEAAAQKMTELAHGLKQASGKRSVAPPPEGDPSLALIAGSFEKEAKDAQRALKGGYVDYARQSLRTLAIYCVACHTRHDAGPEFPKMEISPKMASLSPLEKAELLTALRNFDGALEQFDVAIADTAFAKNRQLEWGRAVRSALAVAVRAKRNPDAAIRIIDRASALPELPTYLREKMAAWKTSAVAWKKEGDRILMTEEEIYKEATRLNEEAKAMQKYSLDHSADILYLRASLAAHEQLARYPEGKHAAQALLLLGAASSLVEDPLMLPMPKLYYEACVRRAPHSTVARDCFVRFEEDVYFGYTGSGGTRIPDDMRTRLNELRKLSEER